MRWMTRVFAACVLLVPIGLAACRKSSGLKADREPETLLQRLAQTEGTIRVLGLKDQVRVVRDHSGVPHIYAKNVDDLFLAQGFVQAQDRLFQIDLWRRSAQGRLAEILGPEFVERDRLARLMHYRGDIEAEWTSYAPDAKPIVEQFVKGINAWVTIAGKNPPIEFVYAGYAPEFWKPEDLLSRAEGFTMGGNALGEVFRTAEEVLRLPKFRCISGIDKLDGGIFPGNCDPRVDALNKLFDDWLRIRGIAGPFGLDIAAVMHEPREAISLDRKSTRLN